jgi:hypothetical protein
MTEFDRCTVCRGRRIVTSLGMIEKKCMACGGVGHIATANTIAKEPRTRIKAAEVSAVAKINRLEQLKNDFI